MKKIDRLREFVIGHLNEFCYFYYLLVRFNCISLFLNRSCLKHLLEKFVFFLCVYRHRVWKWNCGWKLSPSQIRNRSNWMPCFILKTFLHCSLIEKNPIFLMRAKEVFKGRGSQKTYFLQYLIKDVPFKTDFQK